LKAFPVVIPEEEEEEEEDEQAEVGREDSQRDCEEQRRRKTVRIAADPANVMKEGSSDGEDIIHNSIFAQKLVGVKGGKKWRRTMHANNFLLGEDLRMRRRTTAMVKDGDAIRTVPSEPHPQRELEMVTPRKSRSSFAIVPSAPPDKNVDESVRSSAAFADTSVFTCPEVSDGDKLLARCSQKTIMPFAELLPEETLLACKKIGEGSFGEVFMLPPFHYNEAGSGAVLKIVPIDGDALVNGEAQTKLADMLAEITVSTELSRLGDSGAAPNFVKVRDVFLTKGHYPSQLLNLWDDFDELRGSENDRPDGDLLPPDQLFVAIIFGNGGSDLEGKELHNAVKALAIFQQVVHALAVAEDSLKFEHRDLHWGNILIGETEEDVFSYKIAESTFEVKTEKTSATVIDFSLSRLAIQNAGVIFNDLSKDPALFKAEGDYQFDIYRMMQTEVGDNWEQFQPKTNIMWLHYLLDKLISVVPYKNKKSQVHKKAMKDLKRIKGSIMEYSSALAYVQENGNSR